MPFHQSSIGGERMTSDVEYRPIPGFPGYSVGNDGSVWSRYVNAMGEKLIGDKPKRLKAYRNPKHNGGGRYPLVVLCVDGKKHPRTVHSLVLEVFVGPRPHGMVGRHLNDIPTDNRLENLAWGTQKQNCQERNSARGDRGGTTKISDAEVAMIRELMSRHPKGTRWQPGPGPFLARWFGVNHGTISQINTRKHRKVAA